MYVFVLTNYNLKMEQTNKAHHEELQVEQKPIWTIKNKQVFIADQIMLICNGAGTILFAWGDSKVFDCKVEELHHRNLFELGFTKHSLDLLRKDKNYGILEHHSRRKMTLEFINKEVIRAQTEEEFNEDKDSFLKKIVLKTSLMFAKFGQNPVQPGKCRIKRQPVSLFNLNQNQQVFTLVEASIEKRISHFHTSFNEYVSSLEKLPPLKRVLKKK